MTTKPKSDTFITLCKELGKRINSVENALLCHRAHQAYLVEFPDTARGKGNKMDRDPNSVAFRKAAAEASGVAPATIDALLQVGKAMAPLPATTRKTLLSSSLGNSMRLLRKLATKEHDKDRAALITNFAKSEKSDVKTAMKRLKTKLGLMTSTRESKEAKVVVPEREHSLAQGEHFEITIGRYLVRVTMRGVAGGRSQLTAIAVTGERKEVEPFLKEAKNRVAAKSSIEPAKKAA